MSETAEQPVPVTEVQPAPQPEKAAAQSGEPEQANPTPALPRNPESFTTATLKGAVEAGATFVREAATPQSQASEQVTPVRIFNKEQQNVNIPDSVRDALRQKTAEQMFGKRAEKAAQPARARAQKPIGAKERQIRAELQTLAKTAPAPVKLAA